jgi:hypothetical protein
MNRWISFDSFQKENEEVAEPIRVLVLVERRGLVLKFGVDLG